MLRFRILGPIELSDGERAVSVGGKRQRTLLAYLLISANRAVSADELLHALWDEQDPVRARKSLQVAVTRLRKALDASRPERESSLVTVAGGYRLDIAADELDAARFEAYVRDGQEALADGRAGEAATSLREGLELWRGAALADVAYEPFAQGEIRRLEALRSTGYDIRIEADLALGRHADVIGELEARRSEDPTRERITEQLMLALYRSGRQADALAAYRATHMHLATELGLEPGPALTSLQARVLNHDESLASAPRSSDRPATVDAPAADREPPQRRARSRTWSPPRSRPECSPRWSSRSSSPAIVGRRASAPMPSV